MSPPARERGWSEAIAGGPRVAESPKILLLGWQGTLAPDFAWPQRTPVPERLVELTAPLLREASAAFRLALERSGLRFAAEAASPESLGSESLGSALGERLLGVYALPVSLRRLEAGSGARVRADRMARLVVADWIAAMASFVRRLRADRESLARWMGDRELRPIERIGSTASDVHGPAGAVIAIAFEGGPTIFYKPRPVTGEMLWAELQAAVARVDRASALPAARVLAGGASDWPGAQRGGASGFGWMSELRHGTCDPGAYWRSAGALLCLAQHAGLGDLHMGNVLATEHGPGVLDAECLGGAGIAGWPRGDGQAETLQATGLLPVAAAGMPDVSGLFGGPGSANGVLVPIWETAPDGHPALRFVGARLLEHGNCGGDPAEPLRSLPGILAGYSRAIEVLREIRSDLLAPGGWVERLGAFHAPRVVLRSTLTYGVLMSRLLLDDRGPGGDRRERLRRWLEEEASAPGAGLGRQPGVLDAEVEALLRIRVPRFHLAAGRCDLRSEVGRVVARGVGSATPGELVGERLRSIPSSNMDAEVADALGGILFRGRRAGG